jgi:hypothetical protein
MAGRLKDGENRAHAFLGRPHGAVQHLSRIRKFPDGDFGEATLVNGQASVALDRTFASTIDPSRSYLVFITPEGDCHGLYVANKTLSGFAVRELMGGRNTVTFEYRIVAHPYADTSTRLAVVPANSRAQAAAARPSTYSANPRSPAMAVMLARTKSMRAGRANRVPAVPRALVMPAPPVINVIKH